LRSIFYSFGSNNSQVTVDDVVIVTVRSCHLSFGLDPATDSGKIGDDLTNFRNVNLIGTSDPAASVARPGRRWFPMMEAPRRMLPVNSPWPTCP
jgi:hypothetical protein